MNKKTKMSIIVLVVVLGIVLIINIIRYFNYDNKIENYIVNMGFNNNSGYLYSKQISKHSLEDYNKHIESGIDTEYEVQYFNIDTYQLTKDKTVYSDNITKNLTATFDYKDKSLSYIYRINFNNTNIIMDGIYEIENKKFTCESSFFYQIDIDSSKEDICNKVKFEIENFYNETKVLFQNPKILNYMYKK